MLNKKIEKAYKILEGKELEKDFITDLASLEGEDILDLASLANKVKNKYAKDINLCTIMNVKSGICKENCRFCAQSSHYNTGVDIYPLKSNAEILANAKEAFESGINCFGIVTSGTGYPAVTEEFKKITDAVDEIHQKYPGKKVCVSIGYLTEETAYELSKHDIHHFNINLQTNPEKYNDLISTTHRFEDKITTIKLLKKYGIKVCSGGIIGLGENAIDRIEMAFALRELDVDVIPINILLPIKGTPLEDIEPLPVSEIVKTFALFRLINPAKTIKFAAGRETKMKDFQGLILLSGANGFISGGYLTTRGREIFADIIFRDELKLFIRGT